MEILDGKKIAQGILENTKNKIESENLNLGLAVILVGYNEASRTYVRLKEEAAGRIGINFQKFEFNEDVSEEKILRKIDELNDDMKINGILVQLPLPDHLDREKVIDAISPKKDVDGFQSENIKAFFEDSESIAPVLPMAIMKLIESAGDSMVNKKGAIICNSEAFGSAMQFVLKKLGITSTYILRDYIYDRGNPDKIVNADILITVCGSPDLISGRIMKRDVMIIDGGITRIDGKVKGDINPKSVESKAKYLTPVPGGVGPVTVACLMENVYQAAKKQIL